MRKITGVLITGLLCLSVWAQTNILNQPVTLQYQDISLSELLKTIHHDYGIKFSYLNNEIPADKKVSLNLVDIPLHKALEEILADTDLAYQEVSGQIIIKKAVTKKVSESAAQQKSGEQSYPAKQNSDKQKPTAETKNPKESANNSNVKSKTTNESILTDSETSSPTQENDAVTEIKPVQMERPVQEEGIVSTSPKIMVPDANQQLGKKVKVVAKNPESGVKKERTKAVTIVEKNVRKKDTKQKEAPKKDKKSVSEILKKGINFGMDKGLMDHIATENETEIRPFHIGLIYPLSTNGIAAGKYVNQVSLHMLVGYAAGLEGIEFSGFGNIENDYVKGGQFAGFFNVVKNQVAGAQFAGFINLNGGYTYGGQFAGFINMVGDSAKAGQFAGFTNINSGKTTGAQFAGFMNLVADDLDGGQFGGFLNYAQNVKGLQMAGFGNFAMGDVDGFQGSGFINVARNVKGVQLGFINLADSIDGVPIGFISLVRKNGYRAVEVWGSEALHVNAAFKTGVDKFYNIFAFGTQFSGSRWGFGYGFGTIFPSKSIFNVNLDLISYRIFEKENVFGDLFNGNGHNLNILNTLRLGVNANFNFLSVFVAPTFNVMVSQRKTGEGIVGSEIAPFTVYDRTFNNKTNLRMWPGFHAGIRF